MWSEDGCFLRSSSGTVALAARREDRLKALAAGIEKAGGTARVFLVRPTVQA
jgi:NADP-dependent 3-hydroxy acid dehydrogenase YdfG